MYGRGMMEAQMSAPQIFVVSGGMGTTGEQLARTALAQFGDGDASIVVLPGLRTVVEARDAASGELLVSQGFDSYFGLPYSNDMLPDHPGNDRFRFPPLMLMRDEAVAEVQARGDGGGEEAFPAYLESRIAAFYERAASIETLPAPMVATLGLTLSGVSYSGNLYPFMALIRVKNSFAE